MSIRKDIDTGHFEFPKPFELKLKLKDMLDDEVDKKYFLSDTTIKGFMKHNEHHMEKGTGFIWRVRDLDGVASTLRANASLAPTDNTVQIDTKILISEATKKGYAEATYGDSINLEQPNSTTRRGRVGHGVAQTLTTSPQQAVVIEDVLKSQIEGTAYDRAFGSRGKINNSEGICDTLVAAMGTGGGNVPITYKSDLRIRKLTPKECFRLQGFDDESFAKAESVNSNTQLYKQAGNSICVPVVQYISQALINCGALNRTEQSVSDWLDALLAE